VPSRRALDGMGGGADGGLDVLPRVVVQLREVAALGAEDLPERADVELAGVGADGRAGPEPVAAADGASSGPGRHHLAQLAGRNLCVAQDDGK
jgi:hypothetical protein